METEWRGPGPGNGLTYTSLAPDTSEVYATQRPSGEKSGADSKAGVARNDADDPSTRLMTARSEPFSGWISFTMMRSSSDQDLGLVL